MRWKSGDRKTDWSKKLQLVHPDDTIETWMVEKVSVLHPKTQQVAKLKRSQISVMEVYPTSHQFYDKKTGAPVKHTSYYTFSQSFHGGPGSSRDALGGFNTGQFVEVYEEGYKKYMKLLRSWGFQLKKSNV